MVINNTKISFPKIIQSISAQISSLKSEIMSGTDDFSTELRQYVSDLEFFVSDEQDFIKIKDFKNNSVYVVVSFGGASTNFGNSVCPVTLKVFGTKNKIIPSQMFFSAFCSRWNLQSLSGDSNVSQIWVTPQVSSNFNEAADGFRNVLSVSGTLVIGQNMAKIGSITYKYGPSIGQTEVVPFLAFQSNFSNSLAPQPFGNTEGFAKSETNFSTFSFSISTFLMSNSQLSADALAIQGFRNTSSNGITSTKGPNDDWEIYLTFNNGFTNVPTIGTISDFFSKFKCNAVSIGEKLGDLDTLTISFSR